jgi:hypothetical protein
MRESGRKTDITGKILSVVSLGKDILKAIASMYYPIS